MSSIDSTKPLQLQRSQSLPHLISSQGDSGVGYSGSCSDIEQIGGQSPSSHHSHHSHSHHHHHHGGGSGGSAIKIPYEARLVAELKQLMTIRQHYYPEGGWGWLIMVIVLLVQCITHGLHTSIGILIVEMTKEYRQSHVNSGGFVSLLTIKFYRDPIQSLSLFSLAISFAFD